LNEHKINDISIFNSDARAWIYVPIENVDGV